jgi:large subunit ribosomal protein L18
LEKRVNKRVERERKKQRIQKRLKILVDRPRLCVFKSARHIYAQIVDGISGKILASASTLSKGLKGTLKSPGNIDAATKVGELLAANAKKVSVEKVVFDRSGYIYHGRIKALADAARKGGLKF